VNDKWYEIKEQKERDTPTQSKGGKTLKHRESREQDTNTDRVRHANTESQESKTHRHAGEEWKTQNADAYKQIKRNKDVKGEGKTN